LKKCLNVMRPICSALHYAHQSGVVHADIKPANIMIHTNGTVLVSDFGIARATESATATMVGAGTPAYMPPEQARGQALTPQSDIYSLGIVLYEMLTGGERPFTGERARITGGTTEKIIWEQLNAEPPSLRAHNPNLPAAVENVALSMLDKDPAHRPATTLDVLNALSQAIAPSEPAPVVAPEPVSAAPMAQQPAPVQPVQPEVPRPSLAQPIPWRKVAPLGVLAVLLSLGLTIGIGLLNITVRDFPLAVVDVPLATETLMSDLTKTPTPKRTIQPSPTLPPPTMVNNTNEIGYCEYVVQAGDTFAMIAMQIGSSQNSLNNVACLEDTNKSCQDGKLIDPSILYLGLVLIFSDIDKQDCINAGGSPVLPFQARILRLEDMDSYHFSSGTKFQLFLREISIFDLKCMACNLTVLM
jgi:serine/threonine protein kinase